MHCCDVRRRRLPTNSDVETEFCANNLSHLRALVRQDFVVLAESASESGGTSALHAGGTLGGDRLLARAAIGGSVNVEVRQGEFLHCSRGCVLVSPSNEDMKHGAGLAKAIDVAAGPGLNVERAGIITTSGRLRVGGAVLTGAHNLASIGVPATIHVAAPVYHAATTAASGAKSMLKASVAEALRLTNANGLSAIAICGLGCGVFGWPAAVAT